MTTIDYGLFILIGLSIYRVSFMLTKEEGPFSVFSSLRSRIDPNQSRWIGRGINCPLCVSFWLALPVSFLLDYRLWPGLLLHWLSIAGLAAWLQKMTDR